MFVFNRRFLNLVLSAATLWIIFQGKGHASLLEDEKKNVSVSIPYRPDGNGKGVFWDHYTIRKITSASTGILVEDETQIYQLRKHVDELTFNMPDLNGKDIPEFKKSILGTGLLFIPGSIDENDQASPFLKNVIRKALIRGQPILAVCAGSLKLAQQLQEFYGSLQVRSIEVKNHKNSRMISLGENGVKYNTEIHKVRVIEHTMLDKITKARSFSVNSVHNQAIFFENNTWVINSALSVYDADILLKKNGSPRKSRTGKQMIPEGNTFEAYETFFGSPVMGIQWHPEAYCKDSDSEVHKKIINFMVDAGKMFNNKQKIIHEINTKNNYSREKLSNLLFFLKDKNISLKELSSNLEISQSNINQFYKNRNYGKTKNYLKFWEKLKGSYADLYLKFFRAQILQKKARS